MTKMSGDEVNLRKAFEEAEKNSPPIILIEENDSFALKKIKFKVKLKEELYHNYLL